MRSTYPNYRTKVGHNEVYIISLSSYTSTDISIDLIDLYNGHDYMEKGCIVYNSMSLFSVLLQKTSSFHLSISF
jgi:hypothetical protein